MLATALFVGCAGLTNMRRSFVTNERTMKSLSAFTLGVPESEVAIQNNQLSEYEARWDARLANGTVVSFKSDPFMNDLKLSTNKPSANVPTGPSVASAPVPKQ